MDVLLVSHTHWDREWYRTFEAFRARLVDTVDRVLDLLAADPAWRFLLDGQAIVVEDYLAVRPGRAGELEAAVASGRLAVGPWYVQPDSLLPSGEAHVRNLLEGRRVATSVGGSSRVAYTPDSFGHPAQFPALFAGFGLGPFVYWRGNGHELDRLGPIWRWVAPSGDAVTAYHLGRGYFAVACLPDDPEAAAEAMATVLDRLEGIDRAPTVLMNGIDHALPDPDTGLAAEALAARTGRQVDRGLLDDLRGALDEEDRPEFRGELVGGRTANLLPGVWSSRLGLKLANRRAETVLTAWAEPWAALGRALGLPDEAPALRAAWRSLLANQAHDSIGGCSQDEVHRQMHARYATATELGEQTAARVLERLAGLGPERRTPWSTELDLAVFNPSPFPRTDVVRVALDGHPVYRVSDVAQDIHPLTLVGESGFTADGLPVRAMASADPARLRVFEGIPALDLELVVADVPAFGWRRVHLAPAPPAPDTVDHGRRIESGGVAVEAADDGTVTVTVGGRTFSGLLGLEDVGDRGDTYDADPVPPVVDRPAEVTVTRHRHPSGIAHLVVERVLAVPAGLSADREAREAHTVPVVVRLDARVAPGVERVDLHLEVTNPAEDHRLRLLFPTGESVDRFRSATSFDVAERTTAAVDDTGWLHPAPRTFPHQGWIEANGLIVVAPGLPEGEVTPEGTIAVTLLRAVGWLSRLDTRTRPMPAGPGMPTPGAQCPEGIVADLALRVAPEPSAAIVAADEAGLRAVWAGPDPTVPPGATLVTVEPTTVVLSALKPAEDGDGLILRLANPTGTPVDVAVTLGVPLVQATSVRLDEGPDGRDVALDDGRLQLAVGAHGLRTIRLV